MIKDAAALMTGEPEESFVVRIKPYGIPLEAIACYKAAAKAAVKGKTTLALITGSMTLAAVVISFAAKVVERHE